VATIHDVTLTLPAGIYDAAGIERLGIHLSIGGDVPAKSAELRDVDISVNEDRSRSSSLPCAHYHCDKSEHRLPAPALIIPAEPKASHASI